MKAMFILKEIKKRAVQRHNIKKEFKNDCKEYIKYNYNNKNIETKNAYEAKILRQAHILEKGMSLSNPRKEYGVEKAAVLLDYIDGYVSLGYNISDSSAVQNSIGVIKAYIDFHESKNFYPEKIIKRYNEIIERNDFESSMCCGTDTVSKNEMDKLIHSEFSVFFKSRHSMRQFADTEINMDRIKNAVSIAIKAPSACNRQSCKVYFYSDKTTNTELGKLISGNTGFENEVKNYLVVTSDISAFYDSFERNQPYVDAGIFTMSLTEALHFNGIGSCILQNGEFTEKNKQIKELCKNIPDNEIIVLFIAVGNYKENITFAKSERKSIDDILIIK